MIFCLYRDEFIDRVWGPAELDAVAEFWLRLYESAAKPHSFTPLPEHRTEIRIRGVPRGDAGRVGAALAARAAAADFWDPRVTHPDEDTISLSTGDSDGRDAPPVGLGLPILGAEEFDGLAVEIRFTAADARQRGSSTLVLTGEARGGSLILKAIWREGTTRGDEKAAQYARWSSEAAFLAALDEFRASGAIPVKLARLLFPTRSTDRIGALIAALVVVPLGKPRLAPILLRAVLFLGLLAGCAIAGYWAWESSHHLWLAPLAVLVLIVAWLFRHFLRVEWHIWSTGHAQLRELYGKLNDDCPKLVPTVLDENDRAGTDSYIRKYTAELLAAGFKTLGDVHVLPASVGDVVGRVFVAPDGSTFVAALFQATHPTVPDKVFHYWPRAVAFVCHSFLAGGGYAASTNRPRHGYRRKRTGPECLSRIFPDEHDPVALARLHAEAVAKFAAESGHPPLRHVRFEEYIRLQAMLTEEERRLHAEHPYTLNDHLRWYLQILRREYRG